MPEMTGAKFLADSVHGLGITHVFFMPYIAPRALMEMEKLGMKRIQTHGEKAAAYMADAYARVNRGPGLCMAQSVGAVNLAAGLQDAFLACSPVVAITGRETQISLQRHAYQEVNHVNPFSAVTKYSADVATPEQLPVYLRQAFRAATTGTPGPAHLDLEALSGSAVVDCEGDLEGKYHELHMVEAANGRLIAQIRNHNPKDAGETLQSESSDGGATWSPPHSIGVWGLPSHLLRLSDGRLLMSYGYRRKPYGNQVRISSDHGENWSAPLTLSADGAGHDLGYPSTVELADRSLLSVWYERMEGSSYAVLRQAHWKLTGQAG